MSVILSITLYVIGYMELMLVQNSGADQGFPVGGGANIQICQISPKTV